MNTPGFPNTTNIHTHGLHISSQVNEKETYYIDYIMEPSYIVTSSFLLLITPSFLLHSTIKVLLCRVTAIPKNRTHKSLKEIFDSNYSSFLFQVAVVDLVHEILQQYSFSQCFSQPKRKHFRGGMGIGRGRQGGPTLLLDFENFSKKGCFIDFEWEKTNITTFDPAGKILEKSPSGPP